MKSSNEKARLSDAEIVALYLARNEQAIAETDAKYGKLCMQVSMNILDSHPDAEANVVVAGEIKAFLEAKEVI